MSAALAIVVAFLVFSVLIFLHELGHFMAAKLSGVQVNEFALFMGPALVKWQRGETQYSIRCIPIGGYCAMEGENEDTDNPRSFQKAAWWKRLIILIAGSAMNFLTGLLIFTGLCLPGNQIVEPQITEFTDCCIFNHDHGLQEGDIFLELDGEKIYVSGDLGMILDLNPYVEHDVTVLRNGEKVSFDNLTMGHTHTDENGETYFHYGFTYGAVKQVDFPEKVAYVWNVTVDNVRNVRLSLQMLFTGKAGMKDMAGPVGIGNMMVDIATESEDTATGLLNILSFGGMIAVNLAVMNLLPIPALDGGRVVGLLLTTAIEGITRKKLNPKYEGYIHAAGMILLLALMALIMFKDIFTIFKR